MIASVATTAGLSAQSSAEGLSPRRGGGGTIICKKIPPPLRFVTLPYGSSVAQSTVLPSLGTTWHLANPLKASLRPLIYGDKSLGNPYFELTLKVKS